MSFQAMTWAIEQRTGSPSAKATLWSIANYANEHWCAFPGQELIAAESEQSVDSVQRRIADLIAGGLLRRIKLRRFGRRTHDFFILPPSPYFVAPIDDIRPFLPASCDVIDDAGDAAANCGSADGEEDARPSVDSEPHAAADCGSVANNTTPQSALHAAATVRQPIEPVTNLKKDSPPKPPHASGQAAEEAGEEEQTSEADRLRFHRFAVSYPIPILKPTEARTIWSAMTDDERSQAIEGARGYARFLERERRRALDAHKWLRQRLWTQFSTAPDLAERRFVAEDSEGFAAWTIAHQLRGMREVPYFKRTMLDGRSGAYFPTEFPPLGRGMPKFSQSTWVFIPRGDRRWFAWNERLTVAFGEGVKFLTRGRVDGVECEGAWFPSDWPPPKHGNGAAAATGPPQLTDDDLAVLERMD